MLVCVLACSVFVACNPQDDSTDNSDGHNRYEQAKYTVTFNVNSNDFKLTNNVVTNVLSGTSIDAPKNADGTRIVPVKTGYTFKFWSADGTTEFVFGTTPIVKNTTLTAVYTNNTYKLTPHVDKKVVATKDAETNEYTYELEDCETGATIASDANLSVTYNTKSENLDCATAADGDEFLFWFYVGNDGKPVRLTKVATSSQTVVTTENTWLFTRGMDVYAMFKSTLPKVTVEFDGTDEVREYPVNDTITKTDSDEIAKKASKDGYKFAKWFYQQTITENDEEKVVDKDFTFKTDSTTGTTLLSACGLQDYFTPATLKMCAKWTKQVTIASESDFETYYNLLRKENPSEDEQKEIAELLEADVTFKSIAFTKSFEPLFDENHVFNGTIDGGVYDENEQVGERAKLIGGTFGNEKHASVFGYVSGTIKNVVFENVGLKISADSEGKYENAVYVGYVATVLSGNVENCTVTAKQLLVGEKAIDWVNNGMKAVCFGGIAAKVAGSNSIKDSGMVRNCSVVIEDARFACESLAFGGVCATSNSASTLSANTINVVLSDVYCLDDTKTANGRAFAKIGGIASSNGGQISKNDVTIKVSKLESIDETYFGGVCADNSGSIITTKVNATLQNATVGGAISQIVCVGGIVGRNEGYILNSYCEANIDVTAQKKSGIIAVGGIVGSNFSDKTDSSSSSTTGIGAINSTYCIGSIKVNATAENITLYVGGIAGRNSQSKISSCFVVTDIEVANTESGINRIGRTFGKHESKVSMTADLIHYASDKTFTLNGSSEFEHTDTTQGKGHVASDLKASANLNDKNFIVFDSDVWTITDKEYPTLK